MIIFLVVIVIIVAVGGMYAMKGGKEREKVPSSMDSKPTITYTTKAKPMVTQSPKQTESKKKSIEEETKEHNNNLNMNNSDKTEDEDGGGLVEIYRNTPIAF